MISHIIIQDLLSISFVLWNESYRLIYYAMTYVSKHYYVSDIVIPDIIMTCDVMLITHVNHYYY